MAVSKALLQEVVHLSSTMASTQAHYTPALDAAMNALSRFSPEVWAAVGKTIMEEGAYRMIARMETKEGRYADSDFGNTATDELLSAENTLEMS